MKTLAGWIIGIFGLGLVLGSFLGGTAALNEAEPAATLEETLAKAPLVDCGFGREAVLEPVLSDGKTTVRVKCVATVPEPMLAPAPAPMYTTPVYSPQAPVVYAPAPTRTTNVRTAPVEVKKSRSAKDTALIIGGSAGAGAGIGALAKGKKGALVGAAIGAAAGTAYDLATRNKK